MARKAYSDEERAQVKEALMVTMIQCIADRGLIHSSIDVLCKKVGISKTFFYSFFLIQGGTGALRPAISAAQAVGLRPSADGRPDAQLAGGRGDLPEKLLLRCQKRSRCFVH